MDYCKAEFCPDYARDDSLFCDHHAISPEEIKNADAQRAAVMLFQNPSWGRFLADKMWGTYTNFSNCIATLCTIKNFAASKIFAPKTACYIIGDGTSPQTAVIFSEITTWNPIFVVDPQLDTSFWEPKISGHIHLHKTTTEDFTDIRRDAGFSIVIGTRSHADFEQFWNRVPSPALAVCIPCCGNQLLWKNLTPFKQYTDPGINAKVFIYKK
jgi:hypothetical protein